MFGESSDFKETKINAEQIEGKSSSLDRLPNSLEKVASKVAEMFSDDYKDASKIEPTESIESSEIPERKDSSVERKQDSDTPSFKELFEKLFSDDLLDSFNQSQQTRENDNSEINVKKSDNVAEKNANDIGTNESIEKKEKDMARTPEKHGHWDGERGNSKWIPDGDYVPPEKSVNPDKPYSNPDSLSWNEIMKKYGIDSIPFKNGFPDFSEISKGTVEIEGFETGGNVEKNRNFRKADIELAKQRGCTPEEVKKWREENNYTWHECEDKKTMQKVPNEVHANVPHDGGRSQKD